MDTTFTVDMQATPGVSWRVVWRCPLCMAYHALPGLWGHLREAHGWDREAWEIARLGHPSQRKVA